MPTAKPTPPDADSINAQVTRAIEEDLGTGDITAALLPSDKQIEADIISREPIIVCGAPWVEATFKLLDPHCEFNWPVQEGDYVAEGTCLVQIKGSAKGLVSAERTALNFLQILSGTATLTRRFAQQISGLPTTLLDTRKTIPGLRQAQKYAVRCGGGHNHRMGLYDVYLLKENHCITMHSLTQMVSDARKKHPQAPIIVEVESIEELKAALKIKDIDRILLDNFSLVDLKTAVDLNQKRKPLEASGNISLHNIQAIAKTGVNFISVGSLTKHVYSVDLSMRFKQPIE